MLEANVFTLYPSGEVITVVLARTIKAGPASGAVATAVGKWCNHKVTGLHRGDCLSNFFDNPDRLVTGVLGMGLNRVNPPEVPKVGATHTRPQDLNDYVIWLLDGLSTSFNSI